VKDSFFHFLKFSDYGYFLTQKMVGFGANLLLIRKSFFRLCAMVHFAFWWWDLLVKDLLFCPLNPLATETVICSMIVTCRD